MVWQEGLYTGSLVVSAVVSTLSAWYVWIRLWKRWQLAGSVAATALLLACAEWALMHALEVQTADLAAKFLWTRLQYLGIVLVPPTWLAFMLLYTGREGWLTRRGPLLGAVPVLTTLLIWTNELHGLVWNRVGLVDRGNLAVLDVSYGPWYGVHVLYSYLLLLAATFVAAQMLFRSRVLYRWQATALLVTTFLPWLANVVYLFQLLPGWDLDLTPQAFNVTSLAFVWGLSGLRLGDMISMSRGTVVQIMSDGVLVLDARDRVAHINPAAERLIGRTASEVVGQPVGEVWPAWPRGEAMGGDAVEAPKELAVGEGEQRRVFDLRLSRHLDWRGRLVGQAGVLRDITERQQAAESIRHQLELDTLIALISARFVGGGDLDEAIDASLADLGMFSDASRAYLFLLTDDGRLMSNTHEWCAEGVSPQIQALQAVPCSALPWWTARLRAGETIQITDVSGLPPEAAAERELLESQGIKSLLVLPVTVKGALAGFLGFDNCIGTGEWRPQDLAVLRLCSEILGNALARRQAEMELRQSESRFRRLAENAPDIVFRYDLRPDQRVNFVSPAVTRVTGYTPDEFYADPDLPWRLADNEDRALLQAIRGGGTASASSTIRFRHRDGRTRWVALHLVEVRDEAGNLEAVEGIATDVTRGREMEEKLLRAQRLEAAGQVAGQVAHDIGNFLTPLMIYPALIKESLPEGHAAVRHCDAMSEVVEMMAELNEDLLALGRRGRLEVGPVDINRLVGLALEDIPSPPDTLAVVTNLAEDLLPVVGSQGQLRRVISNLVANARDAMGDAGVLTVSTRNARLTEPLEPIGQLATGEYVVLSVQDTGSGIPPEIRERVFEPFFSTKGAEKGRGSGLGLTIVQSIVSDHGGGIDLVTEMGAGTVFSVYLPARPEESAPPPTDLISSSACLTQAAPEAIVSKGQWLMSAS